MLAKLWLVSVPLMACTCGPGVWAPLCETFHLGQTVFLGTVVDHNDNGSGKLTQRVNYLVRVDESFKGLDPAQKEVFIDPGSFTSCMTSFETGKQYLFVTGASAYVATTVMRDPNAAKQFPERWESKKDLKVYFSPGCSPTDLAERKTGDLAWLRMWLQGGSRTKVSGLAIQNHDPFYRRPNLEKEIPAAGARLLLKSNENEFETFAEADGTYSFDGIPAGSYTLTGSAPQWTPPRPETFAVAPGGCIQRNLSFGFDGKVTGILLDHEGNPAKAGIRVELVQVLSDGKVSPVATVWANTGRGGRFKLERVPTGKFVMGVNLTGAPTATEPFAPTFFPGVRDSASAQRVEAGSEDLMFRLPAPFPTRKVTVRVLWADGSPVEQNARVDVYLHGKHVLFRPIRSGNVAELELLAGFDYVLQAEYYASGVPPPLRRLDGEKVPLPAGSGPVELELRLKSNKPQ